MTMEVERPAVAGAPSPAGLSTAEAQRRLSARGPLPALPSSRSYGSIVRANVFTVFNLILAVFGALTLLYADWRDALFLGVFVSNSAIGITQEVRAKRALDRLAALVEPTATLVRDGRPRRVHVEELVVGDLVRLAPGDQVVADGRLVEAEALTLDESIVTGESEPADRHVGDDLRSGSFAVEGAGAYEITAVGRDSYAVQLAGEARRFRHPRSPLERALNRLLVTLVVVMAPLGALLAVALWERETPSDEAIPTSVAAVVSLIPEGLILLAGLVYAVAALRMARRGALVQQLNAVESLASVDLICLDKTGTLTENALRVVDVVRRLVRVGPLRSRFPGRERHADDDRRGVPGGCREAGGRRPVLVPLALERRASRRPGLRPWRTRALRPGPVLGPCRSRGGERAASRCVRDEPDCARRRGPHRCASFPGPGSRRHRGAPATGRPGHGRVLSARRGRPQGDLRRSPRDGRGYCS